MEKIISAHGGIALKNSLTLPVRWDPIEALNGSTQAESFEAAAGSSSSWSGDGMMLEHEDEYGVDVRMYSALNAATNTSHVALALGTDDDDTGLESWIGDGPRLTIESQRRLRELLQHHQQRNDEQRQQQEQQQQLQQQQQQQEVGGIDDGAWFAIPPARVAFVNMGGSSISSLSDEPSHRYSSFARHTRVSRFSI